MIYREYGSTGKKVSAISFGGMRFEKPEDIDANAALLTYAQESGINYFDTAPFYCGDHSEEIVGRALSQMPRDDVYVATKCGGSDGDHLRQTLERSVERLGGPIDFYHIWCLMSLDDLDNRIRGGAVKAAQKARDEGLIKHLVCSTHMTGRETAELIRRDLFEGITIGFNALNFPYRQVGLSAAGEAEIGVVTMNPLAGGVIPQFPDRFDFIRMSPSTDIVSSALRFNLSHPAVTSALVGFSNREQIIRALMAIEEFQPYTGAEIRDIEQRIEESFEGLCTGCGYCLPCPQNLPVPRLMEAFNHTVLYDDDKLVQRLKMHWGLTPDAAQMCTACGECETRCTQHLPIIERMEYIEKLKKEE